MLEEKKRVSILSELQFNGDEKTHKNQKNQDHLMAKSDFFTGLVFFIVWLLIYAWNVIVTNGPAGYREGANMLSIDFLLNEKNQSFQLARGLRNPNIKFTLSV